MKRVLISLLTLALVLTPITLTLAQELPAKAEVIGERLAACTQPFYPEILLRFYDTDGDLETAEYLTIHAVEFTNSINPVKEARVLVVYNGPKDAQGNKTMGDVFLKFVNRPIEKITGKELQEKYPVPCDLLPKLTERAAGGA